MNRNQKLGRTGRRAAAGLLVASGAIAAGVSITSAAMADTPENAATSMVVGVSPSSDPSDAYACSIQLPDGGDITVLPVGDLSAEDLKVLPERVLDALGSAAGDIADESTEPRPDPTAINGTSEVLVKAIPSPDSPIKSGDSLTLVTGDPLDATIELPAPREGTPEECAAMAESFEG